MNSAMWLPAMTEAITIRRSFEHPYWVVSLASDTPNTNAIVSPLSGGGI